MHWLTCPIAAPALPATWLIATGASPANLAERSALRRETARTIIAAQLGLPVEAIAIGHDERGRPLLAQPVGTGLYLSLATRAGFVALALAPHPVGVDIERLEPLATPPLAVLHPQERTALLTLHELARPLAFAELWAAKEAYVKALGTGFARAPESFSVTLTAQGVFSISDPERPGANLGMSRVTENGGQESLAAAVVVLS
ncbi:4'-phosphopantetheinyl transferase family protein [Bosea psychrotolerans]|uniref:Phosphopantetheine--protein transferase-like protein n=1 Tax=Bosea psychrotolerans TaxID=1871628 RepID=A0A2S4M007_9HYPH|nr:4'-phosphopantetheinyl transferase superfamily protein [Bosea psychrotolerans]POR48053.1 phosphopantetheine--protein transferase-like protein [Bosea psychrotolerans]